MKKSLLIALAFIATCNSLYAQPKIWDETETRKTERMKWWTDARFGMFIHYNMATYKGVQWVPGYHSPADFNPGGPVDTDAWADAAKAAGMKYAVLTAPAPRARMAL